METSFTHSPPTGTNLISLADAKNFLRVEYIGTIEDALITAYINAAVSYCENYCSKIFDRRSVVFKLEHVKDYIFPIGEIPSTGTVQIRENFGGYSTKVANTDYFLKPGSPGKIKFDSITNENENDFATVLITMTCGQLAAEVPDNVLQAVRFLVGHYYEQRNAVVSTVSNEIPLGVNALLNPSRFIHTT